MRFLGPARLAIIAVVGLLWAITFGALRDFVWADLADGVIRLTGLNRVIRFIILMGFAILIGMLAVLLYNDFWRTQFALESMVLAQPGRGSLMPEVLLPVSLVLLTLAWSYMLTGARYSHPLIATGILVLFVLSTSAGISGLLLSAPFSLWLGLIALFLVILLFVVPVKQRLSPDITFLLMLALVGTYLVAVQLRLVENDELAAIGLGRANVESNIILLRSLAYPFLLLIGLDIANFVRLASSWSTLVVRRRLPRPVIYLALFLLLGRLLYRHVAALISEVTAVGWQATLPGYLGALLVPISVVSIGLLLARLRGAGPDEPPDAGDDSGGDITTQNDEPLETPSGPYNPGLPDNLWSVVERIAPWLLLAYFVPTLAIYLLLQVQGAVGTAAYVMTGWAQQVTLQTVVILNMVVVQLQSLIGPWPLVVGTGAIVAMWFTARRSWWLSTLYLGLFGLHMIWNHLAAPGRWLEAITWDEAGILYFWLALWLVMASLFWLLRRSLTPARAGWLFFLALILQLLQWEDFIEDPFSPFYAFAATGIVAFGIAWDALTAGSWANVGSRTLPRSSRIFLYIGYVLFTVTLINWALATHDLETTSQFTGDAALAGLHLLGAPMLYLLFPLILSLPPDREMQA